MNIHVGIGSWADDEYVGVLYPPKLPRKDRLREYAKHFSHVEVNSSYYATPKPNVVTDWIRSVPENFTFSVKLHRAFSQSPRKTAEKGVLPKKLLTAMKPLIKNEQLACFFLVMPPQFGPKTRSLEDLDVIAELLKPHGLAVELRDRAWVEGAQKKQTLEYFRSRGLIWIAVDMPKIAGSQLMPAVDEVTNPSKAYLRLHGRNKNYDKAKSAEEGHRYDYAAREIAALAKRIEAVAKQAKDVYAIANNHAEDFAPRAALSLQAKLSQ